MTRDPQRLSDYLAHIREAIERIDRYTHDIDEVAFLNQPMVQDAVIRNIEIIGEGSHNIEKRYPAFSAATPNCPCRWPTKCATRWRTATSRWITRSSGGRSIETFPAFMGRSWP